MLNKLLSTSAAALLLSVAMPASAAVPSLVTDAVPNAQLAGQARYSYLFWDVYDAALYAPQGRWHQTRPFALTLTYLRDFDGAEIAERSVKEMRAQGFSDNESLQRWQKAMTELFPDVSENDTIAGVATAAGTSRFYFNGEFLGEIEEQAFTEWFFNIWLGPKTTEPDFRAKLLNLKEAS
ncbi:chalcone isomerase family protein [Alteromonas gilva]|uniref:Chalcone isomerase family protein n=1 Tax=Alteromonas gilva TaxID=2987522 RepID=A0ABT5L6B0_9ALTE|nr:chalcone isomerase family protein [Alteromonas gilva]MDC8832574.1 chalcone isomerase family protein [Alteromonas gilva]